MIRYTCDLCQCDLDPDADLRYVVRIEVFAALEPLEDGEPEEDRDHLLEVHEVLERMDDTQLDAYQDQVFQEMRFDLCPECRKKFAKNPLGRGLASQLNFSEN